MNNKTWLLALSLAVLFFSCEKKDKSFSIGKDAIGALTKTSSAKEITSLFANDSVVMDTLRTQFGSNSKKIKIYEKGGKLLLELTPKQDSTNTIEHVRVVDPRYTSAKGIGLASTFGEINKAYTLKKTITTLTDVLLFYKETDMYFSIDKKELPAELRFNKETIDVVQIPDEAKVKFLMLGWE